MPVNAAPTLLVVGASGYVGRQVVARTGPVWRLIGTHLTRPPSGIESYPLEIRDAASVEALFGRLRPAVVLHLAYRQSDPSVTFEGARNVAIASAKVGARLVLVSTDLVFDGRRGWYREDDPTSPLDQYGQAKVAAEREVLAQGGTVARTSLVFGFDPLDPITERLVAGPLRRGERSRLFVDEYRCPTYAPDLAEALLELAANDFRGILHLAGPQRLSRYDFGLKLATALGLDPSGLISSRREASGLIRPPDCSLDTSLARRLLRTKIRSVDEALEARGS